MTVEQVSRMMDLLSAAYPRYYDKQTDKQRTDALKVWAAMLGDQDAKIATLALKAIIAKQKFPPSISELLEEIRIITQPTSLDEGAAWPY